MKKIEDFQLFADELKQFCNKHRIGLFGTCYSESMLGEITLFDYDNPDGSGWSDVLNNVGFKVDKDLVLIKDK